MTDPVLVVNAGSSSLKLSIVVAHTDTAIAATTIEAWDGGDVDAIVSFVQGHRIGAVGHRVVHGGVRFTEPVVVDDTSREAIASLTSLAPLHQPRALAGIDAARRALPDVAAVACFDTAFHASLPSAAATYAVPAAWRQRWGRAPLRVPRSVAPLGRPARRGPSPASGRVARDGDLPPGRGRVVVRG